MVHLPFPVLLLPELWAVGVAVLTLVARVALDCVRSSLVSAPLAEMTFHGLTMWVCQNVASLLLLLIFYFQSSDESINVVPSRSILSNPGPVKIPERRGWVGTYELRCWEKRLLVLSVPL